MAWKEPGRPRGLRAPPSSKAGRPLREERARRTRPTHPSTQPASASLKEASSHVRPTSASLKEASSHVRPTSASLKEASSHVRPASASLKEASSHVTPTSASLKEASSHVRPTSASLKEASSHVRPTSASLKEASSHVRPTSASLKEASSHVRPTAAPTKDVSARQMEPRSGAAKRCRRAEPKAERDTASYDVPAWGAPGDAGEQAAPLAVKCEPFLSCGADPTARGSKTQGNPGDSKTYNKTNLRMASRSLSRCNWPELRRRCRLTVVRSARRTTDRLRNWLERQ